MPAGALTQGDVFRAAVCHGQSTPAPPAVLGSPKRLSKVGTLVIKYLADTREEILTLSTAEGRLGGGAPSMAMGMY